MKKGDTFEHIFVVDDAIYNGFINLFHDKNPLHVNREFAQGKGFDAEVMHGNILGGFISYFIGECLPEKNVIIHSQEIKYIKPVYKDQDLIFNAEVTEMFQSVNAIEFKFRFTGKDAATVLAKGRIQIGII